MNGGRPTPWRVDVLGYPGCFGAELFGLVDILAIANALSIVLRPGTSPPFRTRVVAVRSRPVPLAGGVTVQADRAGHLDATDQILVPGFEPGDPADVDGVLTRLAPEIGFLRTLADRRTALGSVCLGAFLLAEAGLLDGCAATTSWQLAPELGRRYPKVDVRAAAMVVEDGRITTAAAFTAYTDLALRLVGQRAGDQVARATARVTLTIQTRTSQAPYVDERLLPVAPGERAANILRTMTTGLDSVSRTPPVFERRGDHTWHPTPQARGPFTGLHGGALVGLLCAEMEWEAERLGAGLPVSVTAHLLRPAPDEVFTTAMTTVHRGRRFTVMENRAISNGKELTVARACFVAPVDTPVVPDIPLRSTRVEALPEWRVASPHGGPWFMDTMRAHMGDGIFWFRIQRPIVSALPQLARIACVADWAHGLSRPDNRLRPAVQAFPNPELTVHLVRPPIGEWIGVEATTRWRKDGVGCGRGVLWDEHGEIGLVAMAIVLVPFDTGTD